MKRPRITLGTIAFVILIVAIDFGIVRWAFQSESEVAISTLLFLPILDVLIVRLRAVRKSGPKRTPARLGFLIGGAAATVASWSVCLLAPNAIEAPLRWLVRPIAHGSMDLLTRVLGNSVMSSGAGRLTLGIVFEVLVPMAYFSLPPLFVALASARIARGLDARREGGSAANFLPVA